MLRSTTAKVLGFAGSVAVAAALVGAAATGTGAYFSDTKSGTYTGTTGSIKVTTSGGSGADNLDFAFENLLPGELQSKKAHYSNTGKNTQDVWVVFNDATALAALNELGQYGEVHLASNGTEIFASKNLNDNKRGSCPELNADGTPTGCKPLKPMYKLADNVAPGAGGEMTFTFGIDDYTTGHQETTWLALPYQIVATQDGIQPGQTATKG